MIKSKKKTVVYQVMQSTPQGNSGNPTCSGYVIPGSFVCWGRQEPQHNSYPSWIIRPSPWPEKREPEPLRNFFSLKKALPVAQMH